ncbi:unnamed protein product [Candidula unifasciata]|uniref:Uncharacterized protein n=1 Tax=Candidula unifasciata TaxID=100452 RepID=A0A8S3ZAU0_9EUPU|nr:unnamed protein product [Candidula unifasciata]
MKIQKTMFFASLIVLCLHPMKVSADEAIVCGAIMGVLLTWFGIPVLLSTIGFGAKIAAGSLASTLMSLTARIGSGLKLVAVLQSIGASGVSWTTVIVGGLLGALICFLIRRRVL